MELIEPFTVVMLMLAGMIAWVFSSLAGGGGALLAIPVIGSVLPLALVAPSMCVGSIIGSGHRALLFRDYICWPILFWLLPGLFVGSMTGAYLFSQISLPWLSVLIGLFLIVSGLKEYLLKDQLRLTIALPHFMAAGFITAFLSALLGAVGPVMNPFYLNYGVEKERMIATKAVSSATMQVFKLIAYLIFLPEWMAWLLLGVAIGLGAITGNRIGKWCLKRISKAQFRHFANCLLVLSGILLISKI